ncbi:deoxyribodipyrimidine photo-lyase [Streptomyces sp. ST2-7A]|uniref:cryptochrome/photolyase family protein n=1 Tax=Streptomyces sp. ST2-7A TaxID=2907214 RepID=UPI001F44BB13|nr:deoxyribodipyrimidine photo-lyase [Streptomyces sp. ST2-7A]MCE7081647.1 DNA photolyase family protein [Streptomyces sp. ST2-7A]
MTANGERAGEMGRAAEAVALFTSDLRVHDHPVLDAALADAGRSGAVIPLFVRDTGVEATGFDAPNRRAFLADCLADLDSALRERGGRLVIRSGAVVEEVCRVAAETGARRVHLAAGVSRYAADRERRLRRALERDGRELVVHDAVTTVVPPGWVTPSGGDHFAVFTPYHRQWERVGLREERPAPRRVPVPEGIEGEEPGAAKDIPGVSPELPRGGEGEGRRRMERWLEAGVADYPDRHDDLAGDGTSRLSPYLHFGCVSPVELVRRSRRVGGAGAEAFVRQVAWRDFHHQVLAARPECSRRDYRGREDRWRSADGEAAEEVAAWREGRTGYPIVDAAMRQLAVEGWMHNRGRLLVGSFLTKTLYVDWRVGAEHFLSLLVDGDIANNQMNWQWIAGTGTDTRPNRVLNPPAQAGRFDPDGTYVRRWIPELAGVEGAAVHRPWKLEGLDRARVGDYPDPIVDLASARDRFERARHRG